MDNCKSIDIGKIEGKDNILNQIKFTMSVRFAVDLDRCIEALF